MIETVTLSVETICASLTGWRKSIMILLGRVLLAMTLVLSANVVVAYENHSAQQNVNPQYQILNEARDTSAIVKADQSHSGQGSSHCGCGAYLFARSVFKTHRLSQPVDFVRPAKIPPVNLTNVPPTPPPISLNS